MARTLEQIKADVMTLPVGEKIDLARDLVESVEGDPAVEAAWLEEIKRRMTLSDADDVDADDLFNELRARYQWDESRTRR